MNREELTIANERIATARANVRISRLIGNYHGARQEELDQELVDAKAARRAALGQPEQPELFALAGEGGR